jgi:hypothetical protein
LERASSHQQRTATFTPQGHCRRIAAKKREQSCAILGRKLIATAECCSVIMMALRIAIPTPGRRCNQRGTLLGIASIALIVGGIGIMNICW